MTTDEIVTRWRAGETLDVIAEAAGRSKQAISKRLIRAGFSPRERLYAERAAEGSSASATRLERITEEAEARDAAAARLQDLAQRHDVTVRAFIATVEFAAEAREAAAPFSPDYLAHLIPG